MIQTDLFILINGSLFIFCLWVLGILVALYRGRTFKKSMRWFYPGDSYNTGRCKVCNDYSRMILNDLCLKCRWKTTDLEESEEKDE